MRINKNKLTNQDIVLQNFMLRTKNIKEISINERSFELFGDEKFLSSNSGKKLLNRHHLSLHHLKCYETPEPFLYYVNHNSINNDMLIIENKDTWFTFRKILMENKTILGYPFKYLVYGQGRKIQKSFSYMEENDCENLKDTENIYYFGDIDSSGIDIFYKLKNKYPKYFIRPFFPAYKFLIENENKKRLKTTKKIDLAVYKLFDFRGLGEDEFFDMLHICNENYIIPQEILNYEEVINYGKK